MPAAGENTVIALVDDDPSVRRALGRLLRSMGAEVETFATPREYLASRPPREFTCLLLDVDLPGVTGLELYRQLEDPPPVIFITAHPSETVRRQARRAGAVALLAKPFHEHVLREALDAAHRPAHGTPRTGSGV